MTADPISALLDQDFLVRYQQVLGLMILVICL